MTTKKHDAEAPLAGASAPPPVPSLAPDDADNETPLDATQRYQPLSQRVHVGETLPDFLTARFEVLTGPDTKSALDLRRTRTVIGRGAEADLRIDDERLSREHVSISYDGSEFRIRDESSANGTFLNGSRVVEYALRDGDKVLVGDTLMQFRVGRR